VSAGQVRWGVLATGGIARAFTADLLMHGHRVTAVGSRSQSSARAFAERFSLPRAHGSYEDLLADPEVDVVYVATPHTLHADNALAALAHGKHVLVEKPFTVDAAQARAVLDSARSRGLVALEAMWTRFLPHLAFVRAAVRSGRLGEVRWLHADHTQALPADPAHRLNDPALGGGALLDLGVYPLSFAHDLLGAPVEVSASGRLKDTGVDADVATVLRHAGGAVSTSFSSSVARGPNTAVVLGTAGRLELDAVWYTPTTVTLRDAGGEVVERFAEPVTGRGMQHQAAELERLLAAGETVSPLLPPQATLEVMTVLDDVRAALGVRYPGE
jgi:predicted dehydrogenase